MEGILPPLSGVLPTKTVQIPYITEDRFDDDDDDLSFYDFPRFRGVSMTEDAREIRRQFDIQSLASFTQSWLFFGMLRAFLRQPVRHADFVRERSVNLDQPVVEKYFERWKSELWKVSYAHKRRVQQAAEDMIKFVLVKVELLEGAAEGLDPGNTTFGGVALSVKLLAGLLLAVLEDAFSSSSGAFTAWAANAFKLLGKWWRLIANPHGYLQLSFAGDHISYMDRGDLIRTLYGQNLMQCPLPPGSWSGGGASADFLVKLFEQNGWCPFRARLLCQTFDYLTLNTMAGLVKSNPGIEGHSSCLRAQRCTAHDVVGVDSDAQYAFRHDPSTCDGSCDFIRIPYQELSQILSSGGKPIISVARKGALDLKVVRCTPEMGYTAVSHVWSDGRGNPNGNALPVCQLQWLRETIDHTYHPEYNPFYDETSRLQSYYDFDVANTLSTVRPCTSTDKKRIFFWMDTLCIPVCPEPGGDAEMSKDLRLRAIKQITPVFVGASNSLVLDRELEDTPVSQPAALPGYEFVSYLLGCTWMERGWTLQEGSLSYNCVFQLMGKPYQLSMAMRQLVPRAESVQSPLRRTHARLYRSMTTQLRKQLLEYKRQLVLMELKSKAQKLFNLLQTPLFVWTWNSLINRSCTRQDDGILIFASLLDFDVYQLRLVPQKERLMRVLQGCEELPLSLLYNTGPRVAIEGHPELRWIPEDVKGDTLVTGAILRKTKGQVPCGRVVYSIQQRHRRGDLITLVSAQGQVVSRARTSFHAVVYSDVDSNTVNAEYMLDVHHSCTANPSSSSATLGILVLFDLAYGTSAAGGISGKGAIFSIVSRTGGGWNVQYQAPLTIYTSEQWIRRVGAPTLPEESVRMERVSNSQKIFMSYSASLWNGQLTRRPIYTMFPLWATILGLFMWWVAVVLIALPFIWIVYKLQIAGYIPRVPLNIARIVFWLSYPYLAAIVFNPIRRRVSMFGFKAWLRTFDELDEVSQSSSWGKLLSHNVVGPVARTALNLGRFVWRIREIPVRRQDDGFEIGHLPGEIYIE